MPVAVKLAKFIKGTYSIPPSAQLMATHVVLDLLSAAIAGFETDGARASRIAAAATWGAGEASAWFCGQKMPATGAVFVNSSMASMLDLDDGHRSAAGHPGASIIPAVFAEADLGNYSGKQLMTAIALGYEIAVRISAARNLNEVDTLVTGRWCAQGVAAAVGWLRGLGVQELAQALSIAATCAPNLNAVAYSNDMGNHVKEGIPWATVTGVAAVNLAAAKSTGPIDFLDNGELFKASTLLDNLGEQWMIEGVYFKPYSCCRWAHAAMDAMQILKKEEGIKFGEISAIHIKTFSRALQLNNDVAPSNLEAAQYSIPFCVALVAAHGPEALLPLTEQSLHDQNVRDLAAKVELEVDQKLDRMFSAAVPAELTIIANNKQFIRSVYAPKGEPANPMLKADLIEKLEITTRDLISSKMLKDIKAALSAFEKLDPNPIRRILSSPIY